MNTAVSPTYPSLAASHAALVGRVFWAHSWKSPSSGFWKPWNWHLGLNQIQYNTELLYSDSLPSVKCRRKQWDMEIHCCLSPLPGKKHKFQPGAGRKEKCCYLPEGDALGQETGNLPSLPGGLPPWHYFRLEVFAADGDRAGETSAWGCAVHDSRSGIMPLQLVISQAFNTALPKACKAGVMDSIGLQRTSLPPRIKLSVSLSYTATRQITC